MSVFTHTFEISFDGTEIKGDVEFNEDSKVSYSFTGDPTLTLENAHIINRLFSAVQRLYKLNGGVTKVKITEKK